jgi:hypothetical protein
VLELTVAVLEFAVSGLLLAIATRLTGRSPPHRRPRAGGIRMTRAFVRLIRRRHRLRHLATLGQIRAACLAGREPCSYLLDPQQNFVPEPMELGYEHEHGRHALNFNVRDEDGYFVTEMVAMRDGVCSTYWRTSGRSSLTREGPGGRFGDASPLGPSGSPRRRRLLPPHPPVPCSWDRGRSVVKERRAATVSRQKQSPAETTGLHEQSGGYHHGP